MAQCDVVDAAVNIIEHVYQTVYVYQSVVVYDPSSVEHTKDLVNVLTSMDYPVKLYEKGVDVPSIADDMLRYRMFVVPYTMLLKLMRAWNDMFANVNLMVYIGRRARNVSQMLMCRCQDVQAPFKLITLTV